MFSRLECMLFLRQNSGFIMNHFRVQEDENF